MKKIILLIFSIFITILIIPNVEAKGVSRVKNDYYYTRTHPDGTRYSDQDYSYYIDGRIVYCIEPGVRLGSDYNELDNYNIPYKNKLRILLAAYYGYMYQDRKDYRYAIATQSIIWKEILGTYPVYSTKLWGEGEILDLSYFISKINNSINNSLKQPNLVSDGEILVGKKITFSDTNNVLANYELSNFTNNASQIVSNRFSIHMDKSGNQTISLKRKRDYDKDYKVFGDNNQQHLLMAGNIPELDYEQTFYVNPVTYHFKIIDSETKNELDGITLNVDNNKLTNNDSYVVDHYHAFYVSIISVPEGYTNNNKELLLDNYNYKDFTLTLSIDPFYTDYTIYKTYDEINPEENAIFELINNETNKLQGVYSTNEEGIFNLHLKYGTYTLNQLKGIEGYSFVSYTINNTKPQTRNTNFINLNDEKILTNDDIVDINIEEEPIALELVQTGNNIHLSFLVFIFPLLCLLRKKIIAI
jgi:hypothetical protein